ncbi:T5orf172 domain-containing protein [Aspergillus alliaceus]|uniref:T5orf172 domain-containing protein n=1 Tax=Petromyces alliaceus TaxID=209559 RepID=UPI0012A52599|nr:T5orf172 domain-containing protein [Aspergillus alliaceus]KAB8238406.1 T5orf172 domain-containing protein [Aspergillus alliaceus]
MSSRSALFAASSNDAHQHTPYTEKSHATPSVETPDSGFLSDNDDDDIPAMGGSPSPAARRAKTLAGLDKRQDSVAKRRSKVGNTARSPTDQTVQAYLSQVPDDELRRNPQRRFLESCSPESRPASSPATPEDNAPRFTMKPTRNRRDAANLVNSDHERSNNHRPPAAQPNRTGPTSYVPDSPNRLPETRNSTAPPPRAPDDRLTALPGDETERSKSPLSFSGQPETPGTEVSVGDLGNGELTPESKSKLQTNEDIILKIVDILRGLPKNSEKKKEGYAYILYDPSARTGVYKIGRAVNMKDRLNQHKNKCNLEHWEARKEPAVPIKQYKRLERLVQAELRNMGYRFRCYCHAKHQEYFWGDREVASEMLVSWSRWLREQEPYDDEGRLKDFWVDRLNIVLQYPLSSFTCMATECAKRISGTSHCPDCVRAGWKTFMAPSLEDHFDYFCRMHVPYSWDRCILEPFYMRTPSAAAWFEGMANSIGSTKSGRVPISSTSLTLLIRGIWSVIWAGWTHTLDLSTIFNILMLVVMIYDLFPVSSGKGSIRIAESGQSPKVTEKSGPQPPKTPEAAPTLSARVPEHNGEEDGHVGVSDGGTSNVSTRANKEHSDQMHQ